jgi:hypothetical protein
MRTILLSMLMMAAVPAVAQPIGKLHPDRSGCGQHQPSHATCNAPPTRCSIYEQPLPQKGQPCTCPLDGKTIRGTSEGVFN